METAGGKKRLLIPSGVQDGEVLKILGGGYKQKYHNKKGDHYVKIKIDIPRSISKEEKELYEMIK